MLVSVIVLNYNYGRFLRSAIDSALAQSYAPIEVVVVDDGSTDESRDIIAGYGDRIVAVLKENGGQASAANVGFSASSGQAVCFLDADDMFTRDKVRCVVSGFHRYPAACLVYHKLQSIDAAGKSRGKPWPRAVLNGDIRERVERSGGWWPYSVLSGLAFRRAFIDRLFPMPTDERTGTKAETTDWHWADTYLASVAPFAGPVVGLADALTVHRSHGGNDTVRRRAEGWRREVLQQEFELALLHRTLKERLGVTTDVRLEDRLPHARYRRLAGEDVALWRLLMMTLQCQVLPVSLKLREARNLLSGRG